MRMSVRSSAESSLSRLAQVTEECPCTAGVIPAAHGDTLFDCSPQSAESNQRDELIPDEGYDREYVSSPDLAHRKRGPPASSEHA